MRGEKPAGERVFEVAADLFYSQSIRSVGVTAIVKQAGVAKISLYRNFESKDDLIVAYLENRNAGYWRIVDRIMAAEQDNARAQLRALVSYVASRQRRRAIAIPFINYAAEFPDASHPGHQIATGTSERCGDVCKLSKAVFGAPRPAQLADALFILIEGAYASSQTLGGRKGPAAVLPWAADALIEGHLRG